MKFFILHASAGQGHAKAAEAIYEELSRRKLAGLDVRLFDALHYTTWVFGRGYSFFYFLLVKYVPWLWGFLYRLTDVWVPLGLMAFLRGAHNSIQARKLERFLEQENPELILTTHFLGAEVASRLKREGRIRSRIVVVITDFLVHRFWVSPGTDFYVGMMDETRQALVRLGVPSERIFLLGIPVSPKFLAPVDHKAVRRQLELETDRFTLLITSGSFGSGPLKRAVRELEALGDKIQVIVVCGTNQNLYNELVRWKTTLRLRVLGFVSNMHELMAVSDLVISRSSGLTTSEAMVKGLPMVILSKIPGQEAYNADLLAQHGAAFEIRLVSELRGLVGELVADRGRLEKVRRNMASLARPRAAEEIVNLALKDLEHE